MHIGLVTMCHNLIRILVKSTHTCKQLTKVNRLQHYLVKRIQAFKTLTRFDMCKSMLGLQKICPGKDKRKLMFLYKILDLPSESVCQRLFSRRHFTYIKAVN